MMQFLIVGGITALGGLLIWMVARQSEAKGAAKADAQQKQEALDAVQKHKDVSNNINGLSDDDVLKRLQRWSRG